MTQHWPIPLAAGLIAAATAFGLWQQERAADAARPRSPQAAIAAAEPTTAPVESGVEAAPTPASPAPTPASPAPTPAATTPTPATRSATVAALPPEQHAQLWTDLKMALQTKTGVAPSDKGNGAANFAMDGTAIDLQAPPNWSITVYNINPKQPDADSPNFGKSVVIISEVLGIDPSQKPGNTDNKRTYQRTLTKLGMASITREPTGANTWIVKPANPPRQAIKQPDTQKPAEPAKPAAPVAPPAPVPAAQPKPQGENF